MDSLNIESKYPDEQDVYFSRWEELRALRARVQWLEEMLEDTLLENDTLSKALAEATVFAEVADA